jgi:hypothetical protein
MEAVKPHLKKHDIWINLTDEMVMLGDRFYIKATAQLNDSEKVLASSCGWAREAHAKKGMDEAQITGSASSYARKYALNGLLAIDDTKDADTQDNRNHVDTKPVSQAHVDGCYDMLKEEIDKSIENAVDPDFERMKAGMDRITNDERMATLDKFKNDKPEGSNRKYTTLINDCLKHHPSDDEFFDANLLDGDK